MRIEIYLEETYVCDKYSFLPKVKPVIQKSLSCYGQKLFRYTYDTRGRFGLEVVLNQTNEWEMNERKVYKIDLSDFPLSFTAKYLGKDLLKKIRYAFFCRSDLSMEENDYNKKIISMLISSGIHAHSNVIKPYLAIVLDEDVLKFRNFLAQGTQFVINTPNENITFSKIIKLE